MTELEWACVVLSSPETFYIAFLARIDKVQE